MTERQRGYRYGGPVQHMQAGGVPTVPLGTSQPHQRAGETLLEKQRRWARQMAAMGAAGAAAGGAVGAGAGGLSQPRHGETGGFPDPTVMPPGKGRDPYASGEAGATPEVAGPVGRGGRGGRGIDTGWLPLRDQRRTAAFDREKDLLDPHHMHHTIDQEGRPAPWAYPAKPPVVAANGGSIQRIQRMQHGGIPVPRTRGNLPPQPLMGEELQRYQEEQAIAAEQMARDESGGRQVPVFGYDDAFNYRRPATEEGGLDPMPGGPSRLPMRPPGEEGGPDPMSSGPRGLPQRRPMPGGEEGAIDPMASGQPRQPRYGHDPAFDYRRGPEEGGLDPMPGGPSRLPMRRASTMPYPESGTRGPDEVSRHGETGGFPERRRPPGTPYPESGTPGADERRARPGTPYPESGTAHPDEVSRHGETGGFPDRTGARSAAPAPGGRSRSRGAPQGGIQLRAPTDPGQQRTAAYDPEKEGPPQAPQAASPAPGKRPLPRTTAEPMGGYGLDPQGSQQGLSTNNAANDFTAGAVSYAQRVSGGNPQALYSGQSEADPRVVQAAVNAVDPDGSMPVEQRVPLAAKAVHDFHMANGDKESADKSSFEIAQYGVTLSRDFGAKAQQALQAGDINGAVGHLLAGYNVIPNQATAQFDPQTRTITVMDPSGRVKHKLSMDPNVLGRIAGMMSEGRLGWQAMGMKPPQAAPAQAPAAGGPSRAGPPAAPPPVAQQAQPSVAPAGPSAPPATPAAPAPARPAPQQGIQTKPPFKKLTAAGEAGPAVSAGGAGASAGATTEPVPGVVKASSPTGPPAVPGTGKQKLNAPGADTPATGAKAGGKYQLPPPGTKWGDKEYKAWFDANPDNPYAVPPVPPHRESTPGPRQSDHVRAAIAEENERYVAAVKAAVADLARLGLSEKQARHEIGVARKHIDREHNERMKPIREMLKQDQSEQRALDEKERKELEPRNATLADHKAFDEEFKTRVRQKIADVDTGTKADKAAKAKNAERQIIRYMNVPKDAPASGKMSKEEELLHGLATQISAAEPRAASTRGARSGAQHDVDHAQGAGQEQGQLPDGGQRHGLPADWPEPAAGRGHQDGRRQGLPSRHERLQPPRRLAQAELARLDREAERQAQGRRGVEEEPGSAHPETPGQHRPERHAP